MLKSTALLGALSLALAPALSACDTPSGDAVTVTEAFIASAQAEAKSICGVVPDALSIGALFAGGNVLLSTASGIAKAICAEVEALPASAKVKRKIGGVMHSVHAPVAVDGLTVRFVD